MDTDEKTKEIFKHLISLEEKVFELEERIRLLEAKVKWMTDEIEVKDYTNPSNPK
jgi:uncharacterized small protein (DUF1192 family)